jgi:limonene-1,2-epoxide hydrolase
MSESPNTKTVEGFICAFNANDLDGIMAFFLPDAVYHNMPMAPVEGVAAIRGVINGFVAMASEIEWVLRNVAETSDGTVLTERLDRFLIRGKWVELPVMGAFVLRDGGIAEWRDYFDMNQFQSQLPG